MSNAKVEGMSIQKKSLPATLKADEATPAHTSKSTPRRAGRRPKNGIPGHDLSREAVIECALKLARNASVAEVSMVRVAREMGVTPGLVHYYIGSKDDLLSTVLNAIFRERVLALPTVTGNWRVDLEGVCRSMLDTLAHWPGSAHYFAMHNRFRLFQRVPSSETDYGLAYFDHVGRILQHAGFTATQAALVYDLTMIFMTSISLEFTNRQAPDEHKEFISDYIAQFDRKAIPGADFLVAPFVKISHKKRFNAGLKLLLDGFASWLTPPSSDTPTPRQRRTRTGTAR